MNRCAVVVGIPSYRDRHFPPLEGTPSTVGAIAQHLEQYGQFQRVQHLPSPPMTELTGRELGQGLRQALLEQTTQGNVLIYFRGYGITVTDSLGELKGYLAASDCAIQPEGQEIVWQQQGIPLDSLNELIRKSTAARLLLVLDIDYGIAPLSRELLEQTLTVFQSRPHYGLITVCRQPTGGKRDAHHPFPTLILKGLTREYANAAGQVTGDSLANLVNSQFAGSEYVPLCLGSCGEMAIATYPTSTPAGSTPSPVPIPTPTPVVQSVNNAFNISGSSITNLAGSGNIYYQEAPRSIPQNQSSSTVSETLEDDFSDLPIPPLPSSAPSTPRPAPPPAIPPHPTRPIELFFSYSHRDEDLRDELAKHLSLLKRQGILAEWYDRDIGAGMDWAGEIDSHLNSAQIILLLISPDFMASNYCFDIEMNRAMERYAAREALVIPVVLRPVDWSGAIFAKCQAFPKNAKPVTTWENRDEAFLNIAQGIRKAAEYLSRR